MINTKTKGELGRRIEYDVEHDLFHPQNIYADEYITPTFVEYVQKLEKENAELKKKNLDTQDAVTMQMYTNKANKEIADRQLTKAKDILRMIVYWKSDKKELLNFINKAEQFLKENE